MSRTPPDANGFTLIETLVALAVFSVAALALLRLTGMSLSTGARIDEQMMAQVVARNIAVETLTDPAPPAFGESGGVAENGGRLWTWSRQVDRSPEPRIQQIEIRVIGPSGPGASLILFRRSGP